MVSPIETWSRVIHWTIHQRDYRQLLEANFHKLRRAKYEHLFVSQLNRLLPDTIPLNVSTTSKFQCLLAIRHIGHEQASASAGLFQQPKLSGWPDAKPLVHSTFCSPAIRPLIKCTKNVECFLIMKSSIYGAFAETLATFSVQFGRTAQLWNIVSHGFSQFEANSNHKSLEGWLNFE